MKSKGMKIGIVGCGLALLCLFFGAQAVRAQAVTCDVTWRKADGPRVISGTVTIPANQTVCVEPGVKVQFTSDGVVDVYGRLVGTGTSSDRIVLGAMSVYPNRFEIYGTMDMGFIDVTVPLIIHPGGTLLARDGRFGKYGLVTDFTPSGSYNSKFLLLENCEFDSDTEIVSDNAGVYVSQITVIMRNVTFRREADCNISYAYLYMDGVTTQNNPYSGVDLLQDSHQPQFLDNLNLTNSGDAGITFLSGNYELGPNVTIQNCVYPIRLGNGGGLMPASNVPASGNLNNWIEGSLAAQAIISPFEIPYVLSYATLGQVEILPGVHLKARPNFGFTTQAGPARVLGLPDAPIFFEPFTPGQKWGVGEFRSPGDRMEYVVIDGSRSGIASGGLGGASYYIDNSILRNNDIAINAPLYHIAYLSGNLFTRNGIALNAEQSGAIRAVGDTNPNLFENNTLAVKKEFTQAPPDVRFNWWNSPTGPTTPQNPGGTGDRIDGTAEFRPFRTVRPDTTDHPPVVRLPRRPYRQTGGNYDGLIDANQKVILSWNAFDDRAIVRQKILFSFDENLKENFTVMADNLPPGQREYEFTMPNVGTSGGTRKVIRVVAVDEKGQEGWDEWQVLVPAGLEPGALRITQPSAGQTFRGGSEMPVIWTTSATFTNRQFQIYLVLDADHKLISSASGNPNGAFSTIKLPYISTDSARIAVNAQGSINDQKWFFSEPFAIRPDARWIDAPPMITMTSPAAGQHYQPGSTIPITWTAADDEALRGFSILSSTDGGRTWLTVVENLPPNASSYNWQTPAGTGFADVRVRVVAFDRRFQNSSDGALRSFSTINNQPNTPPVVELTYPPAGSVYLVGQSTFVAANASDPDGQIARVEFYDGTKVIDIDATAPYQVGFNYLSGGTHTLTARAYDNLGAATVSNSVSITVNARPGPAPLPINEPSLSSPLNGATFEAPANITLSAATRGASVSRVEFYQGTMLIGSDTTAPYEITWSNVGPGRYTLFARTIATSGAEAISPPVDIVVGSATTPRRAVADFDGDGKTDIGVFRSTEGNWRIVNSADGSDMIRQWGTATDKLVPGDYDGDGKFDIAVFRPDEGNWYVIKSGNGTVSLQNWGGGSDIPVPGDYDGDGKTDTAVFRSFEGNWYIRHSLNGTVRMQGWGTSEDQPVPGDYDGDGKTDVAVWRPSEGNWYIIRSSNGSATITGWGVGGDRPVPGDYDGDGRTDLAVFRPGEGTWYIVQSSGGSIVRGWGDGSDKVVPGDYDGDGKFDIAVYRPAEGNWYIIRSSDGGVSRFFLGFSDDLPVPAARIQQ